MKGFVCREILTEESVAGSYGAAKDRLYSPINIEISDTTPIELSNLTWRGYSNTPKLLTVCNTGHTLMLNGQWGHGRPHVTGGPLDGSYVFSQIHFHWPSEHLVNGIRYPLEMHVVHFKTSYLTQERALLEKDGTVVVVYLFQVTKDVNTDVSHITELIRQVQVTDSRVEIEPIQLDRFVKPFLSDYFLYWGSVNTKSSSYLFQWIISRVRLPVSRQELEDLRMIFDANGGRLMQNIRRLQPSQDRTVFHVGATAYNLLHNDTPSASWGSSETGTSQGSVLSLVEANFMSQPNMAKRIASSPSAIHSAPASCRMFQPALHVVTITPTIMESDAVTCACQSPSLQVQETSTSPKKPSPRTSLRRIDTADDSVRRHSIIPKNEEKVIQQLEKAYRSEERSPTERKFSGYELSKNVEEPDTSYLQADELAQVSTPDPRIDTERPEVERLHRQEDLNESIKSRRSTETRRSSFDEEMFIDQMRRKNSRMVSDIADRITLYQRKPRENQTESEAVAASAEPIEQDENREPVGRTLSDGRRNLSFTCNRVEMDAATGRRILIGTFDSKDGIDNPDNWETVIEVDESFTYVPPFNILGQTDSMITNPPMPTDRRLKPTDLSSDSFIENPTQEHVNRNFRYGSDLSEFVSEDKSKRARERASEVELGAASVVYWNKPDQNLYNETVSDSKTYTAGPSSPNVCCREHRHCARHPVQSTGGLSAEAEQVADRNKVVNEESEYIPCLNLYNKQGAIYVKKI